MGGYLVVRGLSTAEGVVGFDALAEVGGDLRFSRLPSVMELPEFPSLAEVRGSVELDGLPSLPRFDGGTPS